MGHIFDHAKFNERQASIALSLTDTKHLKEQGYKTIAIFEYGGRKFFGTYEVLVTHFVKLNPTGGDFYVWLQDQELEVKFH